MKKILMVVLVTTAFVNSFYMHGINKHRFYSLMQTKKNNQKKKTANKKLLKSKHLIIKTEDFEQEIGTLKHKNMHHAILACCLTYFYATLTCFTVFSCITLASTAGYLQSH